VVLPELAARPSGFGDDDPILEPAITSHHYSVTGEWQHSETYVGYESDETIAARVARHVDDYWYRVECGTENSYA
jgi:hypothetical protein